MGLRHKANVMAKTKDISAMSDRELMLGHFADDKKEFSFLRKALKSHNDEVKTRHEQNTKSLSLIQGEIKGVKEQIGKVDSTIDTFNTLLPDIRRGINVDNAAEYRKKLFIRSGATVVATLVTISALVPLIQWVAGFSISVHFK